MKTRKNMSVSGRLARSMEVCFGKNTRVNYTRTGLGSLLLK